MVETYGRYGLLRRLAVGGMAEIFLAALHGDAGFEKQVVLKRILPHLSEDMGFVRMFIDEAMMASRLSHPNIIQVLDFGHAAGSYYMAMEYVPGIDLHKLLQRAQAAGRALSVPEVAAIGERIARGLAYTHNLTDVDGAPEAIVHRDVSPHNVMLSAQGEVKVMDFGIARAAARATRTLTGSIKGKLAYMAPEQARGEQATKLSDQFSLGAVLWECLSGRKLFAGDADVALVQQVAACQVPPLQALRPNLPQALLDIVARALHPDPLCRYPCLTELADALTALRYSLGAQGIVRLDALTAEFGQDRTDTAHWSWAQDAQVAAGGTRVLAASSPSSSLGAYAGIQAGSCVQAGVALVASSDLPGAAHRGPRLLRAASAPGRMANLPRRQARTRRTPSALMPVPAPGGHLPWFLVCLLTWVLLAVLSGSWRVALRALHA